MVLPIDQSVCLLCSGQSQLSLWGGRFRSNQPIWTSPLRISFDSYPDVWHQHRASNPNTYQPCFLFLLYRRTKKNSRSVFTALVSCSLSCVPSHTPTSSISSAQCCCSRNHLLDRLPACCSNDLEAFILDLWTCSHHSNSYNTHVRLYK